ncbi:MAG TPA: 4Fe-4S dicluster domain-containing protein [Dehalococcoidales bacterium]|nr:4Fe-4S dicluster domain-containing protein [Dehalococcoidales bacterium]
MTRWGMVIDLDKCTGCQSCSVACKAENNVPHGSPEEHERRQTPFWHKVIAVSNGEYPTLRIDLIPMPCMHCDDAPCVTVCPAKATYRREDGIVIQNFRRCIGCKYCIVACPYGARSFNYKEPDDAEYHRPDPPPERADKGIWPFPHRVHGVVEKCTFCFHRIDQALKEGKKVGEEVVPACAEACPAHAISFGDLDDPEGQVPRLLASRQWIRLREEMGTSPKVFYLTR